MIIYFFNIHLLFDVYVFNLDIYQRRKVVARKMIKVKLGHLDKIYISDSMSIWARIKLMNDYELDT